MTAKVMLSELEAKLVTNSEWILTKHAVIQKAGELLAAQVAVIDREFIGGLSKEYAVLTACRPKISKGERYRELPYVILDHPALFSRQDVFALRTMFWWGNFISVTLHLSGKYKKQCEATVAGNMAAATAPFYINVGEEEWEHHFGSDNYCRVDALDKEMLQKKIVQPSFIKIALQYDLHQWSDMNELLRAAYNSFAFLLKA